MTRGTKSWAVACALLVMLGAACGDSSSPGDAGLDGDVDGSPTDSGEDGGGGDAGEDGAGLDSLDEADSADRVAASFACTDIQAAMAQRFEDDSVHFTALLPESVMLDLFDAIDRSRSDRASRYVWAVLRALMDVRIAEAQAWAARGFSEDALRALVGAQLSRDTPIPVSMLSTAIGDYCPGLEPTSPSALLGQVGLAESGYFCELSPTPDCAEDMPRPPELECPPPLLPCPDCPYIEIAQDELDALLEQLNMSRDGALVSGLVEAYVGPIVSALLTGTVPNPALAVVGLLTNALGPDHPLLDLLVDIAQGALNGASVGGLPGALLGGLIAGLFSLPGFLENSALQSALDAARRRLERMKQYCEERMWAARMAVCELREANRLVRRTAECAEAAATHAAKVSDWERRQDECTADRAAVAAANRAARATTTRLRRGPFRGTLEAFEMCCEMPDLDPCPDPSLVADPIPAWIPDPDDDYLFQSLLRGPGLLRAHGPAGRGRIGVEVVQGWPGSPRVPTGAGVRVVPTASPPLVFDPAGGAMTDAEGVAWFDVWTESAGGAPGVGVPGDHTMRFDVELDFGAGAEVLNFGLCGGAFDLCHLEFVDNTSEQVLMVASDGAVRSIDGAPPTASVFATVPGVVSVASNPEGTLVLAGTSNGLVFDITAGGDFTGVTPWATFDAGGVLTGLAFDGADIWVTNLTGGTVHRITAGGDHRATAAHASGLSFPVMTLVRPGGVYTSESGRSRIVDITAGGDMSAAGAYTTFPTHAPQALLWHRGLGAMYAAGSDGGGAGSLFRVTGGSAAVHATGIFNPADMALHPWTDTWLVNSFQASGFVLDITGTTAGTDLTRRAPLVSGLSNPERMTYVYVRDATLAP